jgi:N,N'-diacetylchitobiose transport system permease protein
MKKRIIATALAAATCCFFISSPNKYTLPLWLTHFIGTEGASFGPLMAGATIIAVPVAIFFMFVQRNLARGLTAGAVRG